MADEHKVNIYIELPEVLLLRMEHDPYIGDKSRFIAMCIRRFFKEQTEERKRRKTLEDDPNILWDWFVEILNRILDGRIGQQLEDRAIA